MARTSAAAVKAVMLPGKDYDTVNAPDLTPFIDSASNTVDDIVTRAAEIDVTMSATKLELIERWLAAHYYQCSDQGYAFKGSEGSQATFHGKTDLGFDGTKYGQTAKRLDTSGTLAAMDKTGSLAGQRVQCIWLGKPPSQQTDYTDRD